MCKGQCDAGVLCVRDCVMLVCCVMWYGSDIVMLVCCVIVCEGQSDVSVLDVFYNWYDAGVLYVVCK